MATATATATATAYQVGHDRGRAAAALCRIEVSRAPALLAVVAAIIEGWTWPSILGAWLLVTAGCAAGGALNDRADVAGDRVNGRVDRPLVAGTATSAGALAVAVAAVVAMLVAQLLVPQPTGAIVTVVAVALAVASATEPVALQRRGVLGLLALGVSYYVLPATLVAGIGQLPRLLPLALLGAGVVAHKDVPDETGDRAAGKRTLVVRHGRRRMSTIAVGLGVAGIAALAARHGPGWWLVAASGSVVSLLLLRSKEDPSPSEWLVARLLALMAAVLLVSP